MNSSRGRPRGEVVPPDGSFYIRQPHEAPLLPTKKVLLRDMKLARLVKSIYQDDELMTESASDMESLVSGLLMSMNCA